MPAVFDGENKAGRIKPVFENIGKYYYDDPIAKKNGEFGIVTADPEGYVFYEAKFRDAPLKESDIEEEIRQVKETGMNCHKYVFFSKSSYVGDLVPETELIPLDSLFSNP